MKSILSKKEALKLALKLSYILSCESEDSIAGRYSYLFKEKDISFMAKNLGRIIGYSNIKDDKMYTFIISNRSYVICMYNPDIEQYYPMEVVTNEYDSEDSGTIFIYIDSNLKNRDNESILRGLYNIFSTLIYPDRCPNSYNVNQLNEVIDTLACIFLIYLTVNLSYKIDKEFEESIKKINLFGKEYDQIYRASVLKLYNHIIPSYMSNLEPEYENEIECNFQNKFETLSDILPYITYDMYISDKGFFD